MFYCLGRAAPGAAVAERVAAVVHSRARVLLALLALVLSLTNASAQTAVEGVIRGVAMDDAADAVAGAAVQAQDASRGLSFTTSCDAHGSFVLAHLPAGVYAVTIGAAGFATLALDRVTVEAGGTAQLEIRLKAVGVRAMVTVTDDADDGVAGIEQPSGAAISSGVGGAEMGNLPVNGRRWQSFALLTPAANADEQVDGLLSFRGLAVTQNSTSVDGIDDDQSFNAVARGAESVSDSARDEESGTEPGGVWRNAASWRRSG
ncbi:MAG: carboxypeptidase-like regulatory domain-containing protein, partial [Burkholderiales bacterium]